VAPSRQRPCASIPYECAGCVAPVVAMFPSPGKQKRAFPRRAQAFFKSTRVRLTLVVFAVVALGRD